MIPHASKYRAYSNIIQQFVPPNMFFNGPQGGFLPPVAGGRGMPFQPQVIPQMQGGRPNQFPVQAQQGGRGVPNGAQGMPPNYGMPNQVGFMQQGQGYPPNYAYNRAVTQLQAHYNAGAAGGRGQPGPQTMQGMPPQMMGGQNMRGRDNRPQFPVQQGGRGNGPAGQMGGFPQQRGGGAPINQQPMMPQGGMGPVQGGGSQADMIMAMPQQQQKQSLGEALFPKISNLQPKLAGKITGMLLEMDNAELFGL